MSDKPDVEGSGDYEYDMHAEDYPGFEDLDDTDQTFVRILLVLSKLPWNPRLQDDTSREFSNLADRLADQIDSVY